MVRPRRPRRLLPLVAAILLLAAACGSSSTDESAPAGDATTPTTAADVPTIVVTYEVLGAVVSDLVGDTAEVEVLMPPGIDPHDFQPSAQEVASVSEADLVVANGLGLEEGLTDALEQAEADGIPVFYATDHVELRQFGEGEIAEGEEHAHEGEEHAHEGDDPHFWVDPVSMHRVVAALGPFAATELGLDLAARTADLEARLDQLDAETDQTLAVVPADRRKLVTGHESMGYFARQYGFVLVGALIPATTSQAAPSAGELAALREQVEREQVPAIFTEIGTPPALSDAIAEETGVEVVELGSHTLPDDGSYFTFIDDIAVAVAGALAPAT